MTADPTGGVIPSGLPDRTFVASVWDSRRLLKVRGFPTAYLDVRPRQITVRAETAVRRLSGVETFTYGWPAVVVERLSLLGPVPFPGSVGILVDLGGQLGKVSVAFGGMGRLAGALRTAGFHVIEVEHWGWETPHLVSADDLGSYADQVPNAIARGW